MLSSQDASKNSKMLSRLSSRSPPPRHTSRSSSLIGGKARRRRQEVAQEARKEEVMSRCSSGLEMDSCVRVLGVIMFFRKDPPQTEGRRHGMVHARVTQIVTLH